MVMCGPNKPFSWVQPQHDGERCSLALLQANRQIYKEMIESLYKLPTYLMWITNDDNFRFLNRDFTTIASLPVGFRFITSLSLAITAILPLPDEIPERWAATYADNANKELQHLHLLKGVSHFFSPSGPGNLKNLDLIIDFPPFFWPRFLGWPSSFTYPLPNLEGLVLESLELNFNCLKDIRVSRRVSMEYDRIDRGLTGMLGELRRQTDKALTEYFESLKKEIAGK